MNLVRNWLGVEGWVIVDEDDQRLAGPFQTMAEMRGYLHGYRDALRRMRRSFNAQAEDFNEMRRALREGSDG